MLDPARCLWGQRPVRYARRRFERPRVDLRRLTAAGGALAGWAEQRLVPKVVLATQTRVLEPAVDERGAWLPSVPAITVIPHEERLWHVAAALASPVAAAWALRETAGTALGATRHQAGRPARPRAAGAGRGVGLGRGGGGLPDGERGARRRRVGVGAAPVRAWRAAARTGCAAPGRTRSWLVGGAPAALAVGLTPGPRPAPARGRRPRAPGRSRRACGRRRCTGRSRGRTPSRATGRRSTRRSLRA